MEQDAAEVVTAMAESVERLGTATGLVERTMAWLEERQAAMNGEIQRIVATVEQAGEQAKREQELTERLAEAERQIAEMRAEAGGSGVRKTLAATTQLLAKQSVGEPTEIEAGEESPEGLSLEERVALKVMRARTGGISPR